MAESKIWQNNITAGVFGRLLGSPTHHGPVSTQPTRFFGR
jgi:hypothetical protein